MSPNGVVAGQVEVENQRTSTALDQVTKYIVFYLHTFRKVNKIVFHSLKMPFEIVNFPIQAMII